MKISVVTGTRAEYGLLKYVMHEIKKHNKRVNPKDYYFTDSHI